AGGRLTVTLGFERLQDQTRALAPLHAGEGGDAGLGFGQPPAMDAEPPAADPEGDDGDDEGDQQRTESEHPGDSGWRRNGPSRITRNAGAGGGDGNATPGTGPGVERSKAPASRNRRGGSGGSGTGWRT